MTTLLGTLKGSQIDNLINIAQEKKDSITNADMLILVSQLKAYLDTADIETLFEEALDLANTPNYYQLQTKLQEIKSFILFAENNNLTEELEKALEEFDNR